MLNTHFDVIIVGTSFSGSFFLHAYLTKIKKNARILILERGRKNPHQWQIQASKYSNIDSKATYINKNKKKLWNHVIGFGGTSNAWWACTPRMMPNDFKLKSTYNVGIDWPITYSELELYYTEAEIIMSVSGPIDTSPYPRSQPYPHPPHRFTKPDQLLKAAYPELYFQQPTARARIATANRYVCCNTGVCNLCPADAKFTILNEMAYLYNDPRVTLLLEAEVLTVETSAGKANGIRYLKDGVEQSAKGDLIVLGANAFFNPYILLNSGVQHPLLGKRLCEQIGVGVLLHLNGLDNFQGSTSITGLGYMLYEGAHRSRQAACLIESWNIPHRLRVERNRWRQLCYMNFKFEDLPDEKNYVKINTIHQKPEIVYKNYSSYTQEAINNLSTNLPKTLAPLPLESWEITGISKSDGHILGTTVMGNNHEDSIVDKYLVHHQIRNLIILGSSVFPTCSPANPTLTIAALTLWAVDHL